MKHQAISWANVDPDLCRHMASPSHNMLKPNHPQTIAPNYAMTEIRKSEAKLMKDTTYFDLTGEFWGVVTYPFHCLEIVSHFVILVTNRAGTRTTLISVSAAIFAHCHIVYAIIINGEILGDSDIYYCWLHFVLETTKINIYGVL